MPDSQEYRRNLSSGQDMAANTQEYKMAKDRKESSKLSMKNIKAEMNYLTSRLLLLSSGTTLIFHWI